MREGQSVLRSLLAGMVALWLSGEALAGGIAAGDFNGDGFMDLAVGTSREDVGTGIDAGVVNVIYGSAAKLASANNQVWNQNRPGIADNCQTDEHFGMELTVGDFNGDSFDDLAIAVPGEIIQQIVRGAVHVIFGSATGL